jgi:hypothetical protein
MLEPDNHTMATIMESVLLDVGSNLFLATVQILATIEDAITTYGVLTFAGDCR